MRGILQKTSFTCFQQGSTLIMALFRVRLFWLKQEKLILHLLWYCIRILMILLSLKIAPVTIQDLTIKGILYLKIYRKGSLLPMYYREITVKNMMTVPKCLAFWIQW